MASKRSYDVIELYRQIWEERFRGKNENLSVRVEFFPYTTLKNTIRRRKNTIFIRISDMLKGAPEEVMRALGIVLFSKLERRTVPKDVKRLYRDHVNTRKMQEVVQTLRSKRSKKVLSGSKGEFYDLKESFDRVNRLYFNGQLKRPSLTWSQRKTSIRFGHHDDALNTIVISRTLDDGKLPPYLLDYIMYHEALHIKHEINYENGRRSVHTRAFKDDEKKFQDREKAEALLKKISRRSVRRNQR